MTGTDPRPAASVARVPRLLDQVDWTDPLSYVRTMYGVPATLNGRVFYNGHAGTIIGVEGHYLRVALDEGEREPILIHPTWKVTYVLP